MTFLLNAGQTWVGQPVRALRRGNRRPVALADALSVSQNAPPTGIVVLSNDFDPEGAPLSVVSASAVHGVVTIEPDQSITYTPPAGFAGVDTVTYVIQDDLGQTRSTTISVSVTVPQLSIDVTATNTLEVTAETGPMTIDVTQPAALAGSYAADPADLSAAPVNLRAPVISGTLATGATLSAAGGLWIHDTGTGTPVQSWQWQRDAVDIAGATAASYTMIAADAGAAIRVVETLADLNGARSRASASVGAIFMPSDDAQLLGWWDASDAATITVATGSLVSAWADKAAGPGLAQTYQPQMPDTGLRTLNGLNVLDFNGGRFMEAARSFPASGDVAFHMALVIDSVSNLYEAVLAVEAVNDFQIDAASSTEFAGRLNAAGIGTTTSLTGGPFSGALILSVVLDRTGTATVEIFVNDVSRGATAYALPLDASAALHVMTNRSRNAWVNGAVAELVVTGDVGNRALHHAYLSEKWGIV